MVSVTVSLAAVDIDCSLETWKLANIMMALSVSLVVLRRRLTLCVLEDALNVVLSRSLLS